MSTDPIIPSNLTYRILFFGALLFLLAYPLDYLPLKFEEPRRALVAIEMLISGNFWSPTINGSFYYNKPPLFNWMIAGLFEIFGFHNWVERLPTFLSMIGMSLATYFFFRKKLGGEVSSLASLFFLVSGHMLFYFSFQGEIDMTYTFIVFAQIIIIFFFFEKERWLPLFLLSYLLMTVGFLMKGLPSIAFQGLTLIGLFVWHRKFRLLFHYSHFLGLGLSFALIARYFSLYANYNDPELLIAKLVVESSQRTTETSSIGGYFIQLVKFPLLLAAIMLPGSMVLLLVRKFHWRSLFENKWVTYCIVFFLFNIPLYWISPGTRDRYLYMFLPFIYLLLFYLSWDRINHHKTTIKKVLFVFSFLIAVALIVLIFTNDLPIIWTLISVLFIVGLIVLVQQRRVHVVLGWILIMLILRFYYNQVVFPIRALSPDNIAATEHAEKVIELTNGEPLYFVGDFTMTQLKLPFRESVEIKEIERLPYQFTYYYSSGTSQILQWVEERPRNAFYITEAENLTTPESIYIFNMEDRTFVLARSNQSL